jgi:hypothetical protein
MDRNQLSGTGQCIPNRLSGCYKTGFPKRLIAKQVKENRKRKERKERKKEKLSFAPEVLF